MDDVKAFFYKFYIPNNAILVLAGNLELEQVKQLCTKWFESIPFGKSYVRNLPLEPQQTQARFEYSKNKVPLKALYKAYHTPAKLSPDFYASDLLSDVLGRGASSLLYQKLVKELKLMSSINAYVTSSIDAGLLVIDGKLNEKTTFEQAEIAINEVLQFVLEGNIAPDTLQKVKNQAYSTLVFGETELLNRAMALAFAENLGDASLVNTEYDKLESVTLQQFNKVAKNILQSTNCSTLHYDTE
jgi:predicted Zn-dependent peptidase